MLSLLTSVVAALAAVALLRVLVHALRQAAERYRVRMLVPAGADLGALFLFLEPRQLFAAVAACAGLLGLAGALVGGAGLALAGMAVGLLAPRHLVRAVRTWRNRKLEGQLVAALPALADALRAGLALPQALEHLARTGPAPLAQEVGLVVREVRLGVSPEDALGGLAARVPGEELEAVALGVRVTRQLGGNLAEVFAQLGESLAERLRLEGRVRALSAQGRLQGRVLALLPPALALVLDALRPDLTRPLLAHPFGWGLVGAVAVLEWVGLRFIRKLVDVGV